MRTKEFMFLQALVLAIVGVLDVFYGQNLGFFYSISWFDIPVHILGGVWAGLFSAWVLAHRPFRFRLRSWHIILCAFLIGIVWELFEAYFGITTFPADTLDTLKDLLDDTIGGALAAYIASHPRFK